MQINTFPYRILQTLFLDVGNTLLSIDFERVARELSVQGISCDAETVRRSEAAARPVISAYFSGDIPFDGKAAFSFYVRSILEKLPDALKTDGDRLEETVRALTQKLYSPGHANLLWNSVIPGTHEALEVFRNKGLQLAVVSNADGTAEKGLQEAGLRSYFSFVVDSHIAGFEKPDPRIFHMALSSSGADPRYTAYVGDLYHIDIPGAQKAGLHTILLDPYDDWKNVNCERRPDLAAIAREILNAGQ